MFLSYIYFLIVSQKHTKISYFKHVYQIITPNILVEKTIAKPNVISNHSNDINLKFLRMYHPRIAESNEQLLHTIGFYALYHAGADSIQAIPKRRNIVFL